MRMVTLWSWVPFLLAVGNVALAASSAAVQTQPAISAVRGVAQIVEVQAGGPALRIRADQSRLSPVLVRIAETRPEPDGNVGYRVEFIGFVAGDYDLRDYLERQDGSPLNLPAMPVSVVSKLDADHGTDLYSSPRLPPIGAVRYRTVMVLLGVVWLSVPIAYAAIRIIWRQQPPPQPIVPPLPSLADQLRPLAAAAILGSLSLAQRGRLELLMYLYWRDRLKLDGPQAQVVQQLRLDPQAGKLLRAVEGWLHSGHMPSAHAQGELASLLEPYRAAPALTESPVADLAEANGLVLEAAR